LNGTDATLPIEALITASDSNTVVAGEEPMLLTEARIARVHFGAATVARLGAGIKAASNAVS
jgi:hypothetical protein